MLRVCVFSPDTGTLITGGEELLNEPGVRWIDLQGDITAELDRLKPLFGLHRLAIEDCLHLDQRPKLEDYQGHIFIVLQGFSCAGKDPAELELHELHFFLGPDWLITVHSGALEATEKVWNRLPADLPRSIGRGVEYVTYMLADELVDRHFPLLDSITETIEDLELEIFDNPSPDQLRRTFALKRTLLLMRKVLSPQRDVVGLLARYGVQNISEKTSIYFRDVYDHLTRLYEQLEANRDFLGNAVEGYLSMVANRTNEVTKQLTLFATIFLPLSFITGFFGQNFEQLSSPVLFRVMVVTVLGLPLGLGWWFRRKQWL